MSMIALSKEDSRLLVLELVMLAVPVAGAYRLAVELMKIPNCNTPWRTSL